MNATRYIDNLIYWRPSVGLSHADIVSKRLNISSIFFHRRIAQSF